jgi:hypothetical protein
VIALLVILAMGFGAMVWAAMNEPVVAGTPETADPNTPGEGLPAPIDLGPTSVVVTPGAAPTATPVGTAVPTATPGPVVTVTITATGAAPGGPSGNPNPPRPTPPRLPTPPPPTGPPAPAATPRGPVAGDFSVTEEWVTGFTARVQLANQSAAGQHWQVSIVFPDNVKNLTNTWISGGSDTATMTRSGQTVVFRSINPLAGNASIGLYFQFNKEGEDFTPSGCTVNNRDCA